MREESPRTTGWVELRSPELAARQARLRVWSVGLTLLLLGTLGAFALGRMAARGLLIPATITREAPPEAPDLIGRDLQEARERSPNLDVLGSAFSASVDSGEVMFQYPPPGITIEGEKPVEVILSAGPGAQRVPDLKGLPQAQALEILQKGGLSATRITRVAEGGYEEGAVVATIPPAGSRIEPGDSLVLAVSSGGAIVEVPDLIGKIESEAELVLRSAQLATGTIELADSLAGPRDSLVVVAQDPPPGRLARSGTAVNMRLASDSRGAAPAPQPEAELDFAAPQERPEESPEPGAAQPGLGLEEDHAVQPSHPDTDVPPQDVPADSPRAAPDLPVQDTAPPTAEPD
jgi:beta-lactam-binding protein with PASTA domain